MTDEEGREPMTVDRALFRTPLQDLPQGWKWALWLLGAGLSALPMALRILAGQPVRMDQEVLFSITLAGALSGYYALMVFAGRIGAWVVAALGKRTDP